jgi:regulator of sigma E protease
MFDFIWDAGSYIIPFIVVLGVLVSVHEFGHYLVARFCGVRVEVFSIGFGPELFGWTDRVKTRWKVSLIPLGGYVKMFGDMDPASTPDSEAVRQMSEEDRKVAFPAKKLWQRFLVVLAGPFMNFLFGAVVLAFMFVFAGQPFSPPVAEEILSGGAAESAGFQVGDRVL